jgi:hypothetical protein
MSHYPLRQSVICAACRAKAGSKHHLRHCQVNRGLVIIGSGCLEKRFQADAEVQPVLVPVPQRELIDEHCAQGKPARGEQPLGRHLAVQTSPKFPGSSSLLVIQVHGSKIATSEEKVAN